MMQFDNFSNNSTIEIHHLYSKCYTIATEKNNHIKLIQISPKHSTTKDSIFYYVNERNSTYILLSCFSFSVSSNTPPYPSVSMNCFTMARKTLLGGTCSNSQYRCFCLGLAVRFLAHRMANRIFSLASFCF